MVLSPDAPFHDRQDGGVRLFSASSLMYQESDL